MKKKIGGLPQEGGLLSYLYTKDLPSVDNFNYYRDVIIDGVCRPVLVATKLIPFDRSLKVIHFSYDGLFQIYK